MKVGYSRVSTTDQVLDLQEDALKAYGCDRIFSEQASGGTRNRPALEEALRFCRAGDILVVWKLDRLGRNLKDLIDIINSLQENNIEFVSLQENIETISATGKLIFHIFGAFAEFERSLTRERIIAGMAASKRRGVKPGRKQKFKDNQILAIKHIISTEKTRSIKSILEDFEISEATYYKRLKGIEKNL